MWVALLMFVFVILIFIAIVASNRGGSSQPLIKEPLYAMPDQEYSAHELPKKKKSLKSVTFSDVVSERIFNKAGKATSDNKIPING